MTQIVRHFAPRVFHHQIYMRLLIDIIEKRECRGKCENAECRDRAKQQDKFSLVSHSKSKRRLHRGFASITASFPYSLINGATPVTVRLFASRWRRGFCKPLSITIAKCLNKACRRVKTCLSFRGAIMAQALTIDNRRDSHSRCSGVA